MRTVKKVLLAELKENPDMFLTVEQVKQVLGVSDPTLYRWRKLHLIPYYKMGGVIRYKAGEIDKFLNDNQH